MDKKKLEDFIKNLQLIAMELNESCDIEEVSDNSKNKASVLAASENDETLGDLYYQTADGFLKLLCTNNNRSISVNPLVGKVDYLNLINEFGYSINTVTSCILKFRCVNRAINVCSIYSVTGVLESSERMLTYNYSVDLKNLYVKYNSADFELINDLSNRAEDNSFVLSINGNDYPLTMVWSDQIDDSGNEDEDTESGEDSDAPFTILDVKGQTYSGETAIGLWAQEYFTVRINPTINVSADSGTILRFVGRTLMYHGAYSIYTLNGNMLVGTYYQSGRNYDVPLSEVYALSGSADFKFVANWDGLESFVLSLAHIIDENNILQSVTIKTQPDKTEYCVGEYFNPTGMIVQATYSDGSTRVLNNYSYSPDGVLTKSDTTITVHYLSKSAQVAINVDNKITNISINNVGSVGSIAVFENVKTNEE